MVTRLVTAIAMVAALAAPAAAQNREGIQVRGHWRFEVFNPDGTLAKRTEIENGLRGGDELLVALLSRTASFGQWFIGLSGGGDPIRVATAPLEFESFVGAIIAESTFQTGDVFPTLTIESSRNAVILKGRATAHRSGSIDQVVAGTTCTGSSERCAYGPTAIRPFSGKAVYIPLEAEQDIRVTVTISFSSAPTPPSN